MAGPYGLYYPFFHTRDANWLKLAALYWPKLFRIVPAGYPTRDRDVAKYFIDELGLLESIPPGGALASAGEVFLRVVEEHGTALRQRYGVGSRTRTVTLPVEQAGAVHIGQVTPALRTALIDADLALSERTHDFRGIHPYFAAGAVTQPTWSELHRRSEDWLFLHQHLISAYMGVLVEHVAAANNLAPTTDQAAAFLAANNWTAESLAAFLDTEPDGAPVPAPTANPAEVIGMLALDYVVPADLRRVSPATIVEIRRRYGVQFQAFHAKVAEVVSGLGELLPIENHVVLRQHLRDLVAENFQQPMEDLRRALREANLTAATTAVNVKTELPAGILLAGGALAAGHPVMAGVAGAAMGLLTVGRGVRRQREQLQRDAAAASYLLNVRRKLRARPVLDLSLNAIRRIATDSGDRG